MLLRLSTVLLVSLLIHTALSSTTGKKSKRQNNERSDKVLLRTKRQHCTCLNVRIGSSDQPPVGPGMDALASTYKCTCNSAGNPMQQQRELQQILQQVEPMSRCLCGPGSQFAREPVMGPMYEQLPEQQQWECHCQHGNEHGGPAPQFFPWNRPITSQQSPLIPTRAPQLAPTYPTFPLLPRQDQPITPHIASAASPAPLPINTRAPLVPLPVNRDSRPYDVPPPYPEQPNDINAPIAPIRRPEPARPLPMPSCPCMEVTVNVIRTDSRGNRVPIRTPMCLCEPPAPAPSIAPVAPLTEAPILQPVAPVLPSPIPSYSSTTNMLPIVGAHPGQTLLYPDGHLVAPSAPVPFPAPLPVLPAAPLLVRDEPVAPPEPPIVPCLMISINGIQGKYCTCTENYRQCSPTQCCNHKTFRSMKGNSTTSSEAPMVSTSAPANSTNAPSAVDLLMEFVDKFRQHLNTDSSKQN